MPDVQPTNNPVPSDHPADARDNFKRIDEFVNLQSPQTSPTRTGKTISTLFDIEARANDQIERVGFEIPVNYEAGLVLSRMSQTVLFMDDIYHAINVPFTTSGTFEVNNFELLRSATSSDLSKAQEQIIGGNSSIFPEDVGSNISNGTTIPSGATHVRAFGDLFSITPTASGVVSLLTNNGCTIGSTPVTFSSVINSALVLSPGTNSERSLSSRFSDLRNFKDFSSFADAASSGLPIRFTSGDYTLTEDTTFPAGQVLYFDSDAKIVVPDGITLTVNATVISGVNPFTVLGNIFVNSVSIAVPADFPTIQQAIDSVPEIQWQRFNVTIADGTYDEEVSVDNKWAGGATIGAVPGERTGLYIVGESKTGVRVKSWLVVSCGGAAFSPQIARQTIFGHGTKTNETASIEFYGCPAGAVLDVNLHSEEADSSKGVQSYDSVISVEGVDFGDELYTDLFTVKHGGKIYSNNNTRQGIGPSPTGRARRFVSNPFGGEIYFSDMSGLTSAAFDRVRKSGAMNGFTYDTAGRAFYGPAHLEGVVSAYHSYFTSESDFTKTESLVDSLVSIDPVRGLNLHCGSTPNAFAQALLRRLNVIGSQNILFQQQLLAAVNFPSMEGAFFEIGIGFGNGRTYIEITPTTVRGVFIDSTGTATSVNICNTSDIVGDNCTFDIFIERDNTTTSTQMANVRFRINTETFETYKEVKAISGSIVNSYEWYTKLQSIDGSERDLYIGELRLYRE